ncbi:hypothetical protein Tco_0132552 [Tanacetum coccineum]
MRCNSTILMSLDIIELLWFVLKCVENDSEAELQVLADLKSILYGLRSEKFGLEICVELNVGRTTAAPRGGRTGGRTGRGGGRTRGQFGDQGNGRIDGQGGQGIEVNDDADGVPDFSTIITQQLQNLLPTILAQVGNQGSNKGNPRNKNGDAVNDNIQGNIRNVIVNNNRKGCTYKEFLACNPKEYDKKGGAIVYTCWIEKMESLQDMSGCEENQKVEYTAGAFIGFMSWLATEPKTIRRSVHKAGTLINEAVRNGLLKKNPKKRRNSRDPSRDRNVRDVNKRTRTGNDFAITTNPVRREYNDTIRKCVSCNLHHPPEMPCRACFNYGRPGHMAKDYRVAPRMVNPVNTRNPTAAPGVCYECRGTDHFKAACPRLKQAQRPRGNRPNQVVANNGGQGRENNDNQARERAFMLGAEDARQDPNIVTGTFTLNDHYATTLFDSGADYSFVSATFIPMLGIEPSEFGFSYEIKIASGQLVEIDKVIMGSCRP